MTTLSRRTLLTLGGACLATAACNGTAVQKASSSATASSAGSASSGASGLGKTVIGLTYIPNIQFAPFYWAASKGLYRQAGVDASLRHHGASEGLFNALTSGQEHFAIAGGDEVLQANSEGMDLVTVAGFYRAYPVVVIVPQESPIRTLEDLKGHTVGVPGRFGETWYGLRLALHQASLTEKEVTVQQIGYTQQAALATGKVDAIMGFANNDMVQFQASGVPVRAIGLGDEVPLVSTSIVTSRSVLAERPDMVRTVCRASIKGIQAVVDDPVAAIDVSTTHVPGLEAAAAQKTAAATLDASIPLWKGDQQRPDGLLTQSRFVAMEKFMRSAGLLTKPVDARRAVDASVMGSA